MKNKLILLSSGLLLSLGACKKGDVGPQNQQSSLRSQEAKTSELNVQSRVSTSCSELGTKMRMYWTVIEDCDVPQKNCLPDVIVSMTASAYKDEFDLAIEQGSAETAEFFENGNGLLLFDYLNCSEADLMYQQLISGDYHINKIVNENNESMYLVQHNDNIGTDEIEFVMVLK